MNAVRAATLVAEFAPDWIVVFCLVGLGIALLAHIIFGHHK